MLTILYRTPCDRRKCPDEYIYMVMGGVLIREVVRVGSDPLLGKEATQNITTDK